MTRENETTEDVWCIITHDGLIFRAASRAAGQSGASLYPGARVGRLVIDPPLMVPPMTDTTAQQPTA